MKVHSIYDAGPEWADRYTVYFKGRGSLSWNGKQQTRLCVGMSEHPFHPQGVGFHGDGVPGKHNGKRIKFEDLPTDCQRLVKQETGEL